VMLDSDLADIYGYELKAMNQQVKRNIERFPEDFMFQLNKEEIPNDYLKSQFVTLNESGNKRGLHIKNIPPRGLWSMRQLCFNPFSMNFMGGKCQNAYSRELFIPCDLRGNDSCYGAGLGPCH
ncbi:MAG: ORF6N domain-containing protein, partial [Lachnospiraceae bacterium]|nr:ORF6N domain-containing protein [Lachnospiraceae bacterium]